MRNLAIGNAIRKLSAYALISIALLHYCSYDHGNPPKERFKGKRHKLHANQDVTQETSRESPVDKEEVLPNTDPRYLNISSLSQADQILFNQKIQKISKNKKYLQNHPKYLKAKTEEYGHHLPKMIIIGSKKCGTGALAKGLQMHPLMPYAGESYYFYRYQEEHPDLNWYVQNLIKESRPSDTPFEKTPIYFFSYEILRDIKEKLPADIKLVNVLCDPVRRVYSEFLHYNRDNLDEATDEKFEELVDDMIHYFKTEIQSKVQNDDGNGTITYQDLWKSTGQEFAVHGSGSTPLLKSAYSIYIKEWYKNFKKDENILTLDGSLLYSDPGKLFVKIQKFLKVPVAIDENNFLYNEERGLFCKIDLDGNPSCPGGGKGRSTSRDVPERVKEKLREVLDPFTRELEVIEGKSFSHWNW